MLLDYPAAKPAGTEEVFRWAQIDAGGVPTLTLTHSAYVPDGDALFRGAADVLGQLGLQRGAGDRGGASGQRRQRGGLRQPRLHRSGHRLRRQRQALDRLQAPRVTARGHLPEGARGGEVAAVRSALRRGCLALGRGCWFPGQQPIRSRAPRPFASGECAAQELPPSASSRGRSRDC